MARTAAIIRPALALASFLGLTLLIAACGMEGGAWQTSSTGRWQAVLVAGSAAQPAFDNAVSAMSSWLRQSGVPAHNIYRLSASAEADSETEPATAERILQRISSLPTQQGDGCFVFVTSHGAQGAGIVLDYWHQLLSPYELSQALSFACASVPTIVVVSSCYSGGFAAGPMIAPNRIILTAARVDRPSFGCRADRTYTVFDECLLEAMSSSATWLDVFRDASACVGRIEYTVGEGPSLPQAYFGDTVQDVSLPR
jgi:Peptidase C13 family